MNREKIKKTYVYYLNKEGFISKVAQAIVNLLGRNKIKCKKGNEVQIKNLVRNTSIRVIGERNKVIILGEINNCKVNIEGNDNDIYIGKGSVLLGSAITELDDGNKIYIGENVGIQNNTRIVALEGKKITIGDNCSISYEVEIRNSDAHSLFMKSGDSYYRSNFASDITIGKNVWIAQQVLILKGTVIGDNCVIGAKSLVHKLVAPDNSLVLGMPSKVVKTEIKWSFEREG